MAYGNRDFGLLHDMIGLMNTLGADKRYHYENITTLLKKKGRWNYSKAKTPAQTVDSYFNCNPDIFESEGGGWFRLQLNGVLPSPTVSDGDLPAGNKSPDEVPQLTYRVVRDSELSRRLKALHANKCQICGETVSLPWGDYSEAHHLKPLRPDSGPDTPENILILCPNHHVLLDSAGCHISRDGIRRAPGHFVSEIFLKHHNDRVSEKMAIKQVHGTRNRAPVICAVGHWESGKCMKGSRDD